MSGASAQPRLAAITYPARPVNGGPLTISLPKIGEWFYEPKYNGWRALVHVSTGTMYNRKGEPLSIAGEFKTALEKLRETPFEWLDCEALERRHSIGRGSLIVLDAILPLSYLQRRKLLEKFFLMEIGPFLFSDNSVYLPPSLPQQDADKLWTILQERNREVSAEFYEGVVAKKSDSVYPIQLQSSNREHPYWVKHRWQW